MKALTKRILARAASGLLLVNVVSISVAADPSPGQLESKAEQTQTTTQPAAVVETDDSVELLKHRSPSSVISGERMLLKAKISGQDGVKLARVYFKTASAERYNFVVLNKGERGIYAANIPAPGSAVSAVEYKIVVQNALGEVYKSEKYSVPVRAATTQQTVQNNGFIDVFSEYPEDTTDTSGFIDNVRYTYGVTKLVTSLGSSVSVASSGSGVVGGTSSTAGGATGTSVASSSSVAASSTATAATTATAASATAAVSMTTVAAVGAGAVGAAVVVDSASSDDSSSSSASADCYTGGVVEVIETVSSSVSYYYGFTDGRPQDYSVYDENEGCLSDETVDSGIVDDTDYSDSFCYSETVLEEIFNDPSRQEFGQLSVTFGETLPCPTSSLSLSQ